jgi:hypothetical protein
MDLKDAIVSIGNKKNFIRASAQPDVEAKSFPAFVVKRMLSYHPECVLLLNELNVRGLAGHNLSNKMQYEFLLGTMPKGAKFSKFSKSSMDSDIDLICSHFKYSYKAARDIVGLLSDADLKTLRSMVGGN